MRPSLAKSTEEYFAAVKARANCIECAPKLKMLALIEDRLSPEVTMLKQMIAKHDCLGNGQYLD